jgi:hypothetical protein
MNERSERTISIAIGGAPPVPHTMPAGGPSLIGASR